MEYEIASAKSMEAFGAALAEYANSEDIVFLSGNLGAGKTTLVRGFLRALGHSGNVKSPTYTLVENYCIKNNDIYHFDLYRLNDPEELEALGIRDYFSENAICFFEWPEKASAILPEPSISINIVQNGSSRKLTFTTNSNEAKQSARQLQFSA